MKSGWLFLLLLALSAQLGQAGSASWSAGPGNGDWNTAANWTPATVPNGLADTATFGSSSITAISLSGNVEANNLIFNVGASAFTISANPTYTLTISGSGIANNSAVTQNFVAGVNAVGQWGTIKFTNNATAGSSTTFTNKGTAPDRLFPGVTEFYDSATAGNAVFVNEATQASLSGGSGGITQFWDNSSATNGAFTSNSGSANGESGGFTIFNGNSTAANATFTTYGASASGASGGQVRFYGNSTAANGTFTNNGSTVSFTNAGFTSFWDNSIASNATLTANAGSNGGDGGKIYFFGYATGGTARVMVYGNGQLDIGGQSGGVEIGSLEGTGNVILGSNTLTVGNTNSSTTFSGIIQNGSSLASGSLSKVGTGTLTLSGANTHSGATTLKAGSLKLSNSLALQKSTVILNISGIVFDSSVVPHAFTFGGLGGTADLTLRDNAAAPHAVALTVGGNNGSGIYSGRLSGSGSLTKTGSGTLTLSGPNDYTGTTVVNGGVLVVNGSLGNGAVTISSGGTLSGTGTIGGPVTVNSGGIVDLNGGTLTINNKITNNGLFVLANGSQLAGVTSFTNNGTLDIMTDGVFTPPNGFVNHGLILDSSVVKAKAVVRSGNAFTVVIDSYTGHTYHLQKAVPPNISSFSDVSSTPAQQGNTGNEISLTDLNATETAAFYRILVNP
jgi:autotransporter-associated beta strand protein